MKTSVLRTLSGAILSILIPFAAVAQTESSVEGPTTRGAHEPSSSFLHVIPPTLVGDGVSQVAGVIPGSASGLFSFSFNVTNLGDKSVRGHLSSQTILLSSSFSNTAIADIDQTTTSLIDVKCLEVIGGTAWWSGTVFFFTPDPRVNDATNTQFLNDVAQGRYIVGGSIIDGVPEKRSLFFTGANVPEVSLVDAGSINSVLVSMLGKSGTSFCKLHDAMFAGNADFLQLDTVNTGTINQSTNCVTGRPPNAGEVLCDIQWLQPDDSTPVAVAPNVAATFSNPPAASLYDLGGLTRDFVAGAVVIGP